MDPLSISMSVLQTLFSSIYQTYQRFKANQVEWKIVIDRAKTLLSELERKVVVLRHNGITVPEARYEAQAVYER